MDNQPEIKNQYLDVVVKLREMFKLQHSMNVLTASDSYLNARLDWITAIIQESSEMIDSSTYKWWKKEEIDVENARIEAVDIWHFLMSHYLCMACMNESDVSKFIDAFSNQYAGIFVPIAISADQFSSIFSDSESLDPGALSFNRKIMLKRLLNNEDHQVITMAFVEILASCRMNFDEFFSRYMLKNALNQLRQNYGYKEGTYQKTWYLNTDEGVISGEDNEIATMLVLHNDLSSFDEIYSLLENHYQVDNMHPEAPDLY